MNLTEWFPPDIPPVNLGEYEVIELSTIPNPDAKPCRAEFARHYGQLGFWRKSSPLKSSNRWAAASQPDDGEGVTYSWRLLKIEKWRGREATPRVKLIQDPEQLDLPLPIKRVKLNDCA